MHMDSGLSGLCESDPLLTSGHITDIVEDSRFPPKLFYMLTCFTIEMILITLICHMYVTDNMLCITDIKLLHKVSTK